MNFQEVQALIDRVDQADPPGQQVDGADASVRHAADTLATYYRYWLTLPASSSSSSSSSSSGSSTTPAPVHLLKYVFETVADVR